MSTTLSSPTEDLKSLKLIITSITFTLRYEQSQYEQPQEPQFSSELYNQQLRQMWSAGGWQALQQTGFIDYGQQANCYQMNGVTYYGVAPEGSKLTRGSWLPTNASRASTNSAKGKGKQTGATATPTPAAQQAVNTANLTSANFSGATQRLKQLSVSK